jgi:hypothetical protein
MLKAELSSSHLKVSRLTAAAVCKHTKAHTCLVRADHCEGAKGLHARQLAHNGVLACHHSAANLQWSNSKAQDVTHTSQLSNCPAHHAVSASAQKAALGAARVCMCVQPCSRQAPHSVCHHSPPARWSSARASRQGSSRQQQPQQSGRQSRGRARHGTWGSKQQQGIVRTL